MTFLLGAGNGRRALICLVVVVGIVSTTMAGTSGAAAASQPIADVAKTTYGPAALRKKPPSPLGRARASLVAAHLQLKKRQYAKALVSLKALRYNLGRAHRAAMAQIGRPPKDPESDDPPGPAAVMAVLDVEYHIMMSVPLFNGMKTRAVVESLRATLFTAHEAPQRDAEQGHRAPS